MAIKLSNLDWKEVGFPGVLTVWDASGRVVDRLRVGAVNLPLLAAMKAEGRAPLDLQDHDLVVRGIRLFDRTVEVRRSGAVVAKYRLVFDQKWMARISGR